VSRAGALKFRVAMAALAALVAPLASGAQRAPAAVASRSGFSDRAAPRAASPVTATPAIERETAAWLAALALGCVDRLQAPPGEIEGPQLRGAMPLPGASKPVPDESNLKAVPYLWIMRYQIVPDYSRYRGFWGCTDWHSAVSSTWVLARIATSPAAAPATSAMIHDSLADHLGRGSMNGELSFFQAMTAAPPVPSTFGPQPNGGINGFERPYGYAWLLELQAALLAAQDDRVRALAPNVAPLAAWMRDQLRQHMEDLAAPVRTGAQNNSAFILAMMLDFAEASRDADLEDRVARVARRFYAADKGCPLAGEQPGTAGPGGTARGAGTGWRAAAAGTNDLSLPAASAPAAPVDNREDAAAGPAFLSPCLSEAALMARILDPGKFAGWFATFLPPLDSADLAPLRVPLMAGPDGGDGARAAALSFQRGMALKTIANALRSGDPRVAVLRQWATLQGRRGFELMRQDGAASHWLPAYALLYLEN